MRNLVLIRGLPGSGKSTLAKRLFPNHVLVAADDYFTDPATGAYNYDPNQIADAHLDCLQRTFDRLAQGYDVVVTNCFIRRHHLYPYLRLRARSTIILIANGEFANTHRVPKETVERMRRDFEL
jgi:predicted kinase